MAEDTTAELPLAGGYLGLFPFPSDNASRARLLDWSPDLVLSLTPLNEMSRLNGADLPKGLASCGIGWLHLPVEDFGVPDPAGGWDEVSGAIRALLASGGRVAIHCRAGCGRTGMAALRLMVETGEDGAEALVRLRSVRPCAVETDAQYRWATGD